MNRHFVLPIAACAVAVLSASSAFAAADKAFLKKAMEGDNSEIHLGQMAAQKGASAGVRDFGRMLVSDHTKGKADVLPVAQSHRLTPNDDIAMEAKAEAAKLDHLSGPAFDREFASYMVKDHKKDIADYEKQAKKGDAATASFAKQTLPTLRKHLQMAQQLRG
jgi:putative membrane protein